MEYTYTLSKQNKAEIQDGTIFLKLGMRSHEIKTTDVTGFYHYPLTSDQEVLVLSYLAHGKKKRISAPFDGPLPNPIVEALSDALPGSANLLHLDKKEALKKLGGGDLKKQAYVAVGILVVVITAGVFLPELLHKIYDSELAKISIEDVYKGSLPDSDYVTLNTRLPAEGLIVSYKPFLSRSTSWHKKGFYPLVPDGWQQGQPIKVVLMVEGGYNIEQFAHYLGKETEIKGVIRNILWEKQSWSPYMDGLAVKMKSPVENPIVIESPAAP